MGKKNKNKRVMMPDIDLSGGADVFASQESVDAYIASLYGNTSSGVKADDRYKLPPAQKNDIDSVRAKVFQKIAREQGLKVPAETSETIKTETVEVVINKTETEEIVHPANVVETESVDSFEENGWFVKYYSDTFPRIVCRDPYGQSVCIPVTYDHEIKYIGSSAFTEAFDSMLILSKLFGVADVVYDDSTFNDTMISNGIYGTPDNVIFVSSERYPYLVFGYYITEDYKKMWATAFEKSGFNIEKQPSLVTAAATVYQNNKLFALDGAYELCMTEIICAWADSETSDKKREFVDLIKNSQRFNEFNDAAAKVYDETGELPIPITDVQELSTACVGTIARSFGFAPDSDDNEYDGGESFTAGGAVIAGDSFPGGMGQSSDSESTTAEEESGSGRSYESESGGLHGTCNDRIQERNDKQKDTDRSSEDVPETPESNGETDERAGTIPSVSEQVEEEKEEKETQSGNHEIGGSSEKEEDEEDDSMVVAVMRG